MRSVFASLRVGVLAGAALAAPVRTQSAPAAVSLAITHVTLIDVKTGMRREDRSVIISHGRITRVGPSTATRLPIGAREVDARGKYLIPGLWDTHVHIFNQVSRRPANTWYFPLLVANGVLGDVPRAVEKRHRSGGTVEDLERRLESQRLS